MTSSGANDPACTDLNNAREGMKTFLTYLEPTTQWVGLAVLPPAPANECGARLHPHTTRRELRPTGRTRKYTIVPLSNDYSNNRVLDPNSDLVYTINCQKGNGYTAYANALEAAQQELDANGRPDVKDVIVFLSDGAANIGPSTYRSRRTTAGGPAARASTPRRRSRHEAR